MSGMFDDNPFIPKSIPPWRETDTTVPFGTTSPRGTPNLDEVRNINAAIRAEFRGDREGCKLAGGFYAGGECYSGQDAVDFINNMSKNSPAYERGQLWLDEYSFEGDYDQYGWLQDFINIFRPYVEDQDTDDIDRINRQEEAEAFMDLLKKVQEGEATLEDLKNFESEYLSEIPGWDEYFQGILDDETVFGSATDPTAPPGQQGLPPDDGNWYKDEDGIWRRIDTNEPFVLPPLLPPFPNPDEEGGDEGGDVSSGTDSGGDETAVDADGDGVPSDLDPDDNDPTVPGEEVTTGGDEVEGSSDPIGDERNWIYTGNGCFIQIGEDGLPIPGTYICDPDYTVGDYEDYTIGGTYSAGDNPFGEPDEEVETEHPEKGTVLSESCDGDDKYIVIADGEGGSTTEVEEGGCVVDPNYSESDVYLPSDVCPSGWEDEIGVCHATGPDGDDKDGDSDGDTDSDTDGDTDSDGDVEGEDDDGLTDVITDIIGDILDWGDWGDGGDGDGDGDGDDDGDGDGDLKLPPSPPRGAGVWEDFQMGIGYQPPQVPSSAFKGQPDYVALTASNANEALGNIIKRQGGGMLLGDDDYV